MKNHRPLQYIEKVLDNVPSDWLDLTTHRLDIYHEELAKTEFVRELEKLYEKDIADRESLSNLPTAYDYIRLGHPLSSVLEWAIAEINEIDSDRVISFSSRTMPILAVLRKNLFDGKATRIVHAGTLPEAFEVERVQKVYGYDFEVVEVAELKDVQSFEGSTVLVLPKEAPGDIDFSEHVDFYVNLHGELGSILVVNEDNLDYISAIQHVRRRETIAMTPSNCYKALKVLTGKTVSAMEQGPVYEDKALVRKNISQITSTATKPLLASSGLSMQYAIMMGLIENALERYPDKPIKFLVPPNCYGGTNDQARRVAACLSRVEILDLPVDRENDMVDSIDRVLGEVAAMDAVPYIIAEIPTNPRVEVPDLEKLHGALVKKRTTSEGKEAVAPVFILDQTFCPNVRFLAENEGIFNSVKALAYVSGSKFPSGGKCTAGYCVANDEAAGYIERIERHLKLCDNEAMPLQIEILAEQLPSMNQRIAKAYANTREFVDFIEEALPDAKINFVSEDLAKRGFTPSVFSLDLPTKGETEEERENYKRKLNDRLIKMMITEIPDDSKYCVSYGQLKGCYWTIPATSTQGTTKESDKDYIARVSVSPDLDLEKHKEVFREFVKTL